MDARGDAWMVELGATYYDRQEVRAPAEREASTFYALPGLIRHALDNAPYFRSRLDGVEPDTIVSREALAGLPVVRKSDLVGLQREHRPFGGLAATPVRRLARIYVSPGPIYDPEGTRSDYWRFARALYAAGLRPGDVVHNAFSYHMTPAGMMVESGARALGCPVIPGGTGQVELQLRAIADLGPNAYAGTPSFLLHLLDVGSEIGMPPATLTKALVSGEAFPEASRAKLEAAGIDAYQSYATADVGLIAYETDAREGLIVDESVVVEIVFPGTGDPVPEGDVGEVVITVFNPDYPLIRFGTGDLSAVLPGQSGCGRTNMRLRGWLGRADQSTKVRGMFVHPHQVHDAVDRVPGAGRVRLVIAAVDGLETIRLRCEADGSDPGLTEALSNSLRAVTGLQAGVELVSPGMLPDDGKIIDDQRSLL